MAASYCPGGQSLRRAQSEDLDEFDESDDSQHGDRIKRHNFEHKQRFEEPTAASGNYQQPIRVELSDTSLLSSGRKKAVAVLANCRQAINRMQLFSPVESDESRRKRDEWSEKEKYTLNSLSVANAADSTIGAGGVQFNDWRQPNDGRPIWESKLQYFLAITSYSIGLGNVIRFPILVQKNGGLAFIIPFVIMLIVEGIPLFYLELSIGQRMRKAAISCWSSVSPFAAGIGLAASAVSFLVGLNYNMIVAWTLYYLYTTLESPTKLPYASCPQTVSGSDASDINDDDESTVPTAAAVGQVQNASGECQAAGSFQYFWYRQTLNISSDVDDWSNFNAASFTCLALAWLISYVCLVRGLSSSRRVVYIASTFPYVILAIFLFKIATFDGMADGVYYLFAPDWSKLADPFVWLQSAAQVFYSLGLGFGGLIALSSYNPINNNCYKDAIKVSLINFFTSLYAAVVIFGILGYKSKLDYNKCVVARNQVVDFYLSDYNLKVVDYGSMFNVTFATNLSSSAQTSFQQQLQQQQQLRATLAATAEDYYDLSDALASIKSMDRQLDRLSSDNKHAADYGDSDVEFIIDTSNMISKDDLDKIINSIPGYTCSIQAELDNAPQGSALVFVVIAEALSQFSDAPFWSITFFLMLFTLGLDSQFGTLEGLLSSLADLNFPSTTNRRLMTGLVCGASFVISVFLFAHGAGSYIFAIFDEFAASFSLIVIALFELIAISYIYGLKRFCDDCELMTGKRPPFIIVLSWRYISPIILLVVTLATLREFSDSLSYETWSEKLASVQLKQWPTWCLVFGAMLVLICSIWIPLVAVLKKLKINILPDEDTNQRWFPVEELREFHDIQDEHKVTKMERILFGFSSDDY